MHQWRYILPAILIFIAIAIVYLMTEKTSIFKSYNADKNEITVINKPDFLSQDGFRGKELYDSNCLKCHGSFNQADGPWLSLAGVDSKWPDKKELFEFIRNPEEVIKRNAYAKKLKVAFGIIMQGFPNLTDNEIQAIINYILWEKRTR
jgi:cytochrome c1